MEHLKQLRKSKNLLQKDMAQILGVERTTYVKYENGTSEPSNEILKKLADYFNVSIDYLLDHTESINAKSSPEISDNEALDGEVSISNLPEQKNMNVSEVIRNLRKSRNITQEQLAEAICVERSSIGKYETGTLPSVDVLIRIADYFGVSTDYILCRDESHNAQAIKQAMKMERLIGLRKQRNLTQQDMARILGISRQAYSNYELGNREADYATLRKIANYFDVTVDYLLGESDIPRRTTDADIKVALFGGDGEVTDEMWDEVRNFAEYVRSKHSAKDEK